VTEHTILPPVGSRATAVTFFEDRAQVHRTADVRLAQGRQTVVLSGITVVVDDPSLTVRARARSEGDEDPRIISAKVRRRYTNVTELNPAEIAALEEERQRAAGERGTLELELDRLTRRFAQCDKLEHELLSKIASAPIDVDEQGDAPPESSDGITDGDIAEWTSALEVLDAKRLELLDKSAECQRAIDDASRAESLARARLNQARRTRQELEALVEIQVDAAVAGEVAVEVAYFTPCALWRPAHIAQLVRSDDGESIRVATVGTVWQQTGEVWEDIECTFSTARPTQASEPPLLSDDVLSARPKTEEERRTVSVEARDVDISVAGAKGSKAIDDMPGVDDGGEPLTLEAQSLVSIPSDGAPFRVQLSAQELPCTSEWVIYPERHAAAHLKASSTWRGPTPLLAGPVVLMRGDAIVGRALAKFAAPGSPFTLGFGPDSSVRVRRTVDTKSKSERLGRRTRLKRTVKLYLSNLGEQAREVTVIGRVPVSEVEAVTVELKKLAGGTVDEDGLVRIPLKLKGRRTRNISLKYEIVHGSNVRLSL